MPAMVSERPCFCLWSVLGGVRATDRVGVIATMLGDAWRPVALPEEAPVVALKVAVSQMCLWPGQLAPHTR